MNYYVIIYILSYVLKFEAAFLLLPAFTGLIYGEKTCVPYFVTALVSALVGYFMGRKKRENMMLYMREGFVSVALSWVLLSVVGAIPMTVCGDIPSYVDSLFEIISGFTTTGASICPNVEVLTHATLMWRSFSHWVGGMGVLVFIMALMPMLGGSNMNLMKAESPGPSVSKLVPHVKDTAKILYTIYLGMTGLEFVFLLIFGMPLFDAITTTFGTVGTGGFGVKADSIAGYNDAIINTVTVFMILSGVNYSAYYLIICRKIKDVIHIEEIRWYFYIILLAAGSIILNIYPMYGSYSEAAKQAFFQVGSIITTTGFATCDFNQWPEFSKSILVMLMFIGACAGSTGGGMKVSRIVILFKTIKKELSLLIHPREIKKITMDEHPIAHETVRATNVFVAVYFVIMMSSVLMISIDGYSFTTNTTAVIATLNNIGPGLDMVGPAGNFAEYSVFSKFVLMFDMLAGRLELFPVMIMLLPATWRRK